MYEIIEKYIYLSIYLDLLIPGTYLLKEIWNILSDDSTKGIFS